MHCVLAKQWHTHTSSHLARWCIFSSTCIFVVTYLPYWALIPKYTLVISLSYVWSVDNLMATPRICFSFIFTDCANMVSSVSIILLLIFILSSSPYATSPCAILSNTWSYQISLSSLTLTHVRCVFISHLFFSRLVIWVAPHVHPYPFLALIVSFICVCCQALVDCI